MPSGKRLPKKWVDLDHAIYDARIRQAQTWREVGETVGMTWSGARQRFYARMAKVDHPEVAEMRAEENLKYDERERHLLTLMALAEKGRDWTAAVGALRGMDQIARSRRALNGLDVPTKIEVSRPSEELDASITDAINTAYLTGAADGAAVNAPD